MKRVEWSEEARNDLLGAVVYLAEFDDRAALRLRRRIDDTVSKLSKYAIGRRSRVSNLFEKPVSGTRYTIVYSTTDEVLLVGRLVHQSRDWPNEGMPSD